MPRVWVKICGITTVDDALGCVDAGADAVGVNLVESSVRCVDEARAREISRAVGTRAEVVGIVANLGAEAMRTLRDRAELSLLQLHGAESPEALLDVLPGAYKAIRVGTRADVADAARFAGARLLVDAKVTGALGGTGTTFDWSLVKGLAAERRVVLAGGLTPHNVEAAVRAVNPYGVDTASGVERPGAPRAKDLDRVRAFVSRAQSAGRDQPRS